MQSQHEVALPEVDKKLLQGLEELGFPRARAARGLHYSGNASLEDAVNWIVDHESDSDIDEMPLVAINIVIESPQPSDVTEVMKIKAKELRDQARRNNEEEEKKLERKMEKERIRAGKELLEAKRIAEENERKRNLALWEAQKAEEKRAREKILRKLEADKLERRRRPGLPFDSPARRPAPSVKQAKRNIFPVKSVTKAEQMRECLRSIRHNHRDDDARVRRAFETLLIYLGNVAKNPDVEKFRKIQLGNPLFHDRIGSLKGGIEFLELCGFERSKESEFLFLPRDKVDMAALHAAAYQLKSAMSNPFFGVL